MTDFFKTLKTRINELNKHFLPKNFDPTGQYTDLWIDRAKAYKLLIHAEFEVYFESIVSEIVEKAIAKWKKDSTVNEVVLALVICYKLQIEVDLESVISSSLEKIKRTQNVKSSYTEIVYMARTQFNNIVKANNGIKENNINRLLLPIGIKIDTLDQVLLSELESFGQTRGEFAHKSKKTHQLIDPKTEFQKVNEILMMIDTFDNEMESMLRKHTVR